jgi:hypothetical protein
VQEPTVAQAAKTVKRHQSRHRSTLGSFLATLPLTLALAAAGTVGTAAGELTMSGTCAAAWCQDHREGPAANADTLALVREQLPALGCDTRRRLSRDVAVIPDPGSRIVFDKTVVRTMSFDEGWRRGQAHEVIVVGWCD